MKETLYNLIQSQGEGAVTFGDVAINLIAALLIGALIYTAYRATHSGTIYSERFNISLVMVTLVTAMVMCVIGNNISLSLGMVGALSIVRFRTAIKDPRDTIYFLGRCGRNMLWSFRLLNCAFGICHHFLILNFIWICKKYRPYTYHYPWRCKCLSRI